jgi:hypothetical protein
MTLAAEFKQPRDPDPRAARQLIDVPVALRCEGPLKVRLRNAGRGESAPYSLR